MKIMRNKSKVAIATLLMLSFAISMFAVLPAAYGLYTAVPDRATGAYISTNPDLIGINQELTVNLWVYPSPTGPHFEMGRGATSLLAHYENIAVTFTRPDGSKDTFMPLDGSWEGLGLKPGETESVGTMWFLYEPNQLGTWSVSFSFPGKTFYDNYYNYSVYYKPSTSQSITFEVQQDNVQIGLPPAQLPSDYWQRPIHSDNREWSQISGDWLASDYSVSRLNPYSTGPNSAHIVWTNQVGMGGIVGGEWGGLSYGAGGGTPPVIIAGKVYYNMPGGLFRCVDLRTGELLYTASGSITQGAISLSDYSIGLSTGIYTATPTAYLWEMGSTSWKLYDPFTGRLLRTLTNAVAFDELRGPKWVSEDEFYSARCDPTGWNTIIPYRLRYNQLFRWNLSKVAGNDWRTGVVWNVSLKNPDFPYDGPGEGGRRAEAWVTNNILFVQSDGETNAYGYDKNTGAKLWKHTNDFDSMYVHVTPDGYAIMDDSATSTMHGFQVNAGGMTEIWVSQVGDYAWGGGNTRYFGFAYGKFYLRSYDGYMYIVDILTGDVTKSDYAGDTSETPFGTWAYYTAGAIADGKVYVGQSEHSPTQPRSRGNKLVSFDAYTGKALWNVSGAIAANAIAEGYLLGTSENDGLMYAFGKGKTETTVTAPLTAITRGQSLVLQGSVLDLSPASAGTAAISDVDMTAWMDYLHMQKEIPMNAKGVEVSLDAVDPNNNFIHIATVTSDSSGLYSSMWAPEVPGKYTVIATFAGSESYWASYAETAVGVDEASAVTPPTEQTVSDNMPIYTAIIAAAIAIIIAIAIVGILLLRKR